MITEIRDKTTGIIRFEIGTVRPDICRRCIEDAGFVRAKSVASDVINYQVEYKGIELQVTSTPTRTMIFGTDRYAMQELLRSISGDAKIGTDWVYDDSKRTDYQSGR